MKKLLLFLILSHISITVFSRELDLWKCSGGTVFTVVVPVGNGNCESHTEQWITCRHPFRADYGYNSVSATSTGPCPTPPGSSVGNNGTPVLVMDQFFNQNLQVLRINELADELQDIHNSNIATVNSSYMNATAMINNSQLYLDALEFRYSLSGYDIDLTNPDIISGCTPLVITLPVIIPENFSPPFDPDCVLVSPNPASTNLSINFSGHHPNVDEFKLIQISTGNVLYSKNSSILPIENISISSFPLGMYNLVITNGIEIHSKNILIQ